jgi:hypothetical protein
MKRGSTRIDNALATDKDWSTRPDTYRAGDLKDADLNTDPSWAGVHL